MGTSNHFGFLLGEDLVDLVGEECNNDDAQVTAALMKLRTAPGMFQLPTPPPTPPMPADDEDPIPKYVSSRWPKRLKWPATILTANASSSNATPAPLERLPSDILWLVLSHSSSAPHGEPLLDRDDHISLILTSRTVAVKYFNMFPQNITLLENCKLLVLDRISAPVARRTRFLPACNPHLEARAKLSPKQTSEMTGTATDPNLKRTRSPIDESSMNNNDPPDVEEAAAEEDEHLRKRRKGS